MTILRLCWERSSYFVDRMLEIKIIDHLDLELYDYACQLFERQWLDSLISRPEFGISPAINCGLKAKTRRNGLKKVFD
jgi:hypothetical protein